MSAVPLFFTFSVLFWWLGCALVVVLTLSNVHEEEDAEDAPGKLISVPPAVGA